MYGLVGAVGHADRPRQAAVVEHVADLSSEGERGVAILGSPGGSYIRRWCCWG